MNLSKKRFCSILLSFCFLLSHAQERQNPFPQNGYDIEMIINFSKKASMKRSYPFRPDVNVYTSSDTSPEFRLNYYLKLNRNWGLQTGISWGQYIMDTYYDIEGEVFGIENVFNNDSNGHFSMFQYFGTYIGVNRFLLLERPKHFFTLSGKIHLLWFEHQEERIRSGLPDSLSYDSAMSNDFYFTRNTVVNSKENLIIAPELGISFYLLAGPRKNFWLKFSSSYTYSGTKPFSGTYQVNGLDESLMGNFEKRFAHISLQFALIYAPSGPLRKFEIRRKKKNDG